MSEEISPIGRAAIDLLETKDWAFEQETLQAAQTQVAAQEAMERRAETRVLLGEEAAALTKSMLWLSQHQHIGRLVGRRAFTVEQDEHTGSLTTSPMFVSKPEYISDGKQSEYESDFYVFEAKWVNLVRDPFLRQQMHRHALTIDRRMLGSESGIEEPIESWNITLRQAWASDELAEVGFSSTQTDEHMRRSQGVIFNSYLADNPWLKDYWNASENSEQPLIAEKRFYLRDEPHGVRFKPRKLIPNLLREPLPRNRGLVLQRLQKDLTRGVGWDYEDEAYLFPLGLMVQARAKLKLGWGQIISKMIE